MAPPRRAPSASPSTGHGLTGKWHGVPVWLLGGGGLVLAYFLYEHFKSSSSSSGSTSGAAPAYYSGGTGTGSGPRSGPPSSLPPPPPPTPPSNPTPKKGKCPPGYTYGSPCPGMAPTCIPPGAVYNCPEQPYKGPPVKLPPPIPAPVPQPGNTAVSTVTPQQRAAAQKSLTQAVSSLSSSSPPVVTSSGSRTTTGALAYNNLVSKGYSQEAALQAAQQIAAANSGVAPGTPQLVAGTPVTSGNVTATNNVTPASYAAAQRAAQTQAQAAAAAANIGTPEQQQIAKTAAQNPQNFGGGWTNVGNGTIRNDTTGQVLPAGTNGIW